MNTLNRRRFLSSSAAAGLGFTTLGMPRARGASPNGKLRVLSIGVIGTIGKADRQAVARHPDAEITGLCDVDSNYLAEAAKDHPDAFTCRDYREAFAKHADKFDAVIVSVPDHSHAPILLTAMAHDKHVYGQKPLVHQLAELVMVERAIKAKPHLVTQLGNQRMAHPGRRAAVEILRQGLLGKAVEAYAWTGSPSGGGPYFNYDKLVKEDVKPPAHLDWDLWLGPCALMPYREMIAPVRWRSYWDFGTNGLGDWGCHVLDVIFFGYDELLSPVSVKTDCAEPAGKVFHVNPCKSKMIYQVKTDKFAARNFPVHYYDSNQRPTPEQLRIPEPVKGSNMTVVVCEGGTLVLEADGDLKIWRDGQVTQGLRMPGIPQKWEPLNHWHAWVDNCLGKKTELRTPFKDAVRITEAALLAVKATRFPGQELLWDKSKLAFTNHAEATKTIVRRQYREGFAPPRVG
jgi:predicted dehydrogenase